MAKEPHKESRSSKRERERVTQDKKQNGGQRKIVNENTHTPTKRDASTDTHPYIHTQAGKQNG